MNTWPTRIIRFERWGNRYWQPKIHTIIIIIVIVEIARKEDNDCDEKKRKERNRRKKKRKNYVDKYMRQFYLFLISFRSVIVRRFSRAAVYSMISPNGIGEKECVQTSISCLTLAKQLRLWLHIHLWYIFIISNISAGIGNQHRNTC